MTNGIGSSPSVSFGCRELRSLHLKNWKSAPRAKYIHNFHIMVVCHVDFPPTQHLTSPGLPAPLSGLSTHPASCQSRPMWNRPDSRKKGKRRKEGERKEMEGTYRNAFNLRTLLYLSSLNVSVEPVS